MPQLIIWKWSTHYASLSAMFNPLQSGTRLEKHLCKQSSQYKNFVVMRTISVMQLKPSHATTKSTLFAVNKDEWDTKKDTVVSALYVLPYAKRPIGTSRTDVEQWKN